MHLLSKHTTSSLEGLSQEIKYLEVALRLTKLLSFKTQSAKEKQELSSKVDHPSE